MRRFTRLTNAFSKKVEEPSGGGKPAFRALQLRAAAQQASRHARDGGGRFLIGCGRWKSWSNRPRNEMGQPYTTEKPKPLKRAGATLLVLSVFLPMSSCTQQVYSGSAAAQTIVEQTQYYYVWMPEFAKVPSTYLNLFAFLWPALAICLARFQPRGRRWRMALLVFETMLLVFSALTIYGEGWWLRRAEAGAYVAASGFTLYLIAWSVETIRRIRDGIRGIHSRKTAGF